MSIEDSLQFIADFLDKHVIFLHRPHVQIQFVAILGSIVLAWFISKWLWRRLSKLFPHVQEQMTWSNQRLSLWQYSSALVHYLLIPVLSLILLSLVSQLLLRQYGRTGLLKVSIDLLGNNEKNC